MFERIKDAWSNIVRPSQPISLVANWLRNVLWLIETRFLSLAQQAYGQNEVVYACMRLLSQAVAEGSLVAYVGEGEQRQPVDKSHPLMQLIRHPNELMTQYEFWELCVIHLAIIGRTTWWKERDNKGQVIALWPLRPDRVGPLYSDSDEPGQRILLGWSYLVPGTYTYLRLPREDVFFTNFADPAGESGGIVEGIGPIQALARSISSDNEATKFVGALLANYAAPTIALKVKAPIRNEQEAQRIKAQFRTEFGGAQRGTPAVLDADTEVQEIGFKLNELEFPSLRSLTETRICATLGVPAALLGLGQGTRSRSLGNGAELRELRRYFAETTLANYWKRLSDAFQCYVACDFGEDISVEFNLDSVTALRGVWAEYLAPYQQAYRDGAITKNEYRAKLSLGSDPSGDVYAMPTGIQEVPFGQPYLPAAPSDQTAMRRAPKAVKAIDPREAAERRLQESLADVFSKLSGNIADRLRRGEQISNDELRAAFARVIEPHLIDAATTEGMRIAGEIGVEFDPAQTNAAMAKWAREYTYDMASRLTDSTRVVLQNAFETFAKTPGMNRGEIENLLLPAFSEARASMIAVTEVTRAYAQSVTQYQADLADSGVSMTRVWQTDNDDKVCDICEPLNGLPESVWSGESPGGPPRHVNCRCSLTLQSAQKAVVV